MTYPHRLIEVDLPIRAISAHARREKSIRHGHISTLHIWWARRPLAACRAVLCAALWPDPADENCPRAFREAVALVLAYFAEQVRADAQLAALCKDHWTRWVRTTPASLRSSNPACWPDMRYALLDFIADFANWDASTVPAFLEIARLLTHAAHLALSDPAFGIHQVRNASVTEQIENLKSQIANSPRPLVVDPFAGGGSIPLEALRVGADAFASDLNPVAVLLNKVVLEYIPKYGNARIELPSPASGRGAGGEGSPLVFNSLAEAVRYWGNWIKEQAERELAEFYPKDPDGATPIAYLWARTITCEGPGCGAEVPLMRSFWLAKKGERSVALRMIPNPKAKRVDFEIIEKQKGKWVSRTSPETEIKDLKFDGTVRRGAATCPVCGYTTPVERVRAQLKPRRGGAHDARLFCVVTTHPGEQGRFYRLPVEHDLEAVRKATNKLEQYKAEHQGRLSLVPDEPTPDNSSHRAVGSAWLYGMKNWGDIFTPRQNLVLATYLHLLNNLISREHSNETINAVHAILALAISRYADIFNSFCMWENTRTQIRHLFTRQALPMLWDYAEAYIFANVAGNFSTTLTTMLNVLDKLTLGSEIQGNANQSNAIRHPLPSDSTNCFFTDPPYYDSVAYAELSDFFYVWLKRAFVNMDSELFLDELTPKKDQAIVWHPGSIEEKQNFERKMTLAMLEGRRILSPDAIGIVVFAHKSTTGWEAQIDAMLRSGWIITGSWPIDTELGNRMNAFDTASLVSSIHLICRPRESLDGCLIENIGDWRDVLTELPGRIRSWLPRLAAEGVVGADAIFACLGPALEIFSRYSRVEKASGEQVTLKEYLEVVWAEVARQALGMIFEGADATGFEEDARLTAIWLWTLSTKNGGSPDKESARQAGLEEDGGDEEEDAPRKAETGGGFTLEYDAARKIAQGLGAHLEQLESLVEIKGDKARLRRVAERARFLFGKKEAYVMGQAKPKKSQQMDFFSLAEAAGEYAAWEAPQAQAAPGATTLDRLHQAMLLFSGGRGEALKRFLVDEGAGKDQRFWRLAQALSALYPGGSDEKRWVDGVLARKKGLGF